MRCFRTAFVLSCSFVMSSSHGAKLGETCGIFDTADKKAATLLKDSGYTKDELKAILKLEERVGRRIPGLPCTRDVLREDALTALEAVAKKTRDTSLAQLIRNAAAAMLKRHTRRSTEVSSELTAFNDEFRKDANATEESKASYERWTEDLRGRIAASEKENIFCVPCDEKQRNDMLIFLAETSVFKNVRAALSQARKVMEDSREMFNLATKQARPSADSSSPEPR